MGLLSTATAAAWSFVAAGVLFGVGFAAAGFESLRGSRTLANEETSI